ncbi:hypothetical protein CDL12_19878 [Handroanthus impetiginosus]|uniref:BZIP domain-containing protein n=1 Tax=Handroanthus impetiginosus TaxID=429701 RepID=A0A2G9GQJ2_9LAMI|nr:hypothetical protein CDL12_19878 [Handroanthus impetiginosus]
MGSSKKIEGPQNPFLLEQSSSCNFTLDEFLINKPINYNLDELVKNNIIPSQECRVAQNPSSSYSSSSSPPIFQPNLKPVEEYPVQTGAENQFEGFVENNPAPLMAKIDHDLSEWEQKEMVLPSMPLQAIVGSNFQVSSEINNGFENKLIMDLAFLDYNKQLKNTGKCLDSQGESERKAESAERKKRRMIKNRESAARSRARKQAYTNQLQQNVLQLQNTNNWLRKRKEVNNLLDTRSMSAPRHQLRRTSSAEF